MAEPKGQGGEMDIDEEMASLAKAFKEAKDRKAELDKESKEKEQIMKEAGARLLEIFDSKTITQIKFEELGTFFIKPSAFPKVEDQEKFYKWLRATNQDSIIKETVHPQTLRAFVKERIEKAEPMPDGVKPGHMIRQISNRA